MSEDKNVTYLVPPGSIRCFITGKLRKDTPEEHIRQRWARSLVEEYGYPIADIGMEIPIHMGRAKKRADIMIFRSGAKHAQEEALIIVEAKCADIKPSDTKQGDEQLISYIAASPACRFGLWVGEERRAYEKTLETGSVDRVGDIPRFGDDEPERPTRSDLIPAHELKSVFRRCHNYIYANAGHQKAEAFHELLKLIFCKTFSYPRTPSRVMGEANVQLLIAKIEELERIYPKVFSECQKSGINVENKRVFDNSKLEDHHALIPLAGLPKDASEGEKNIYDLILCSLGAVFSPSYVYDSLKIFLNIGNLIFQVKGKTVLYGGWQKIIKEKMDREEEKDDQELLELTSGEKVSLAGYEILNKKTEPKSAFTDSSILAVMESPEKHVFLNNKDSKEMDYHFERDMGIGTQATRADILETLLKRKYIERKGKKLVATNKGMHFFDAVEDIESLRRITDVTETARWEAKLKEDPKSFYNETLSELRRIITEIKGIKMISFRKKGLCPCPKCKEGEIRKGEKNYYCSRYKEDCDFKLWKNVFGTNLREKEINLLLTGEATQKMKLKRKDGSEFQAALMLGEDGKLAFVPRAKM